MSTESIDIIRVIAITAFAGGTSFVGAIISKKKRFSEQHRIPFEKQPVVSFAFPTRGVSSHGIVLARSVLSKFT